MDKQHHHSTTQPAEVTCGHPNCRPVTARVVPDRVLCSAHYTIEGQSWLVVDLTEPYDKAFYALPAVLLLDGCEYGRSAFDSDRGRAYYRTGALFAVAKRTITNRGRS